LIAHFAARLFYHVANLEDKGIQLLILFAPFEVLSAIYFVASNRHARTFLWWKSNHESKSPFIPATCEDCGKIR
jgi:hypothetical protein